MKKALFPLFLALTVSVNFANSTQTSSSNSVSFANFFYQKGYKEGYEKGFKQGYMEGYKQALEDAKVLLEVANKQIKAVKSGCQLLEEKYGSSLALVLVKENGKYVLKPFITRIDLVDDWQQIAKLGVPVIDQALAIQFEQSKQRLLTIPKLSEEGSIETPPPIKEYIAKLPLGAIRFLKGENIPFAVVEGKDEVIAIFNTEQDYQRFCQTYKVCK